MNLKRIAALGLGVLTLAMPFAGCKKSENKESEEAKTPQVLTNVYRGTLYPLPEPFTVDSRATVLWDEGTGQVTCAASGYLEEEDEEGNFTYSSVCAIFTLDENGVVDRQDVSLPGENGYIQRLIPTDGGYISLWAQYEERSDSERWYLTRVEGDERIDSDELSTLFGASDRPWFYIENMCVDGDGDIYLNQDQEILVLNRDFIRQFTVSSPGWINSMAASPDGQVYVTGWFTDSQAIAPIDKASRSLGKESSLPDNSVNDLCFGAGHDFYYTSNTGVFAADWEEDGTIATELVMDYLNSNVSRDDVSFLGAVDADTLLFSEQGSGENWYRSPSVWRHAEDVDLSATTVIEIAYTRYLSYQIPSKVAKFNRENPDTRIIMTDYSAYDTEEDYRAGEKKLATDLVNGLAKPSIVAGDPTDTPLSTMLAKNLYQDLSPYVDRDDLLNRQNLFGAVLSAFTAKDGSLWALTGDFSLVTILSTPEILGEYANRDGWTIGEMIDFAASLPEGVELLESMTQDSASFLLQGGYGAFIDEEEAVCDFEDPEFVKYLEFVKTLPKDWEEYQAKAASAQVDWGERYRLYHEGKIALKGLNFSDLSDFLSIEMDFGTKDYVMIGFPKAREGDSGHIFSTSTAFAVTKYAEDPEAAWKVLRYLIDPEIEYFHGIPATKSAFETMCEEYYRFEFEFYYDGSASWGPYDPENPRDPAAGLSSPGIVTYFTKEDAERVKAFLDEPVTPVGGAVNDEISAIINEEITALTGGSVDAPGCAKRIQSRVGIWLAEHK